VKAVRFHDYGGPELLRCEEAPPPAIQEGDLLVKLNAAGVNPADAQFRRGDYREFAPLPLPFIPGWDLAGTVVAAAPDVHGFQVGERVFAMADMRRQGAYAEYIVVRAGHVARAPARLPLEHAAAVPLAALTAWAALFDAGSLRPGQTVLVHAGAGGVGLFAIQLARRAGARVLATASAANHALLLRLGAHEALDYRSGDFAAGLKDIDVAVAMPPPDTSVADRHGVRTAMIAVTPNGDRLAQIAALIDAGELEVLIDSEFPLADAAAAHRRIEGGHARGKIILRIQ
jgi:NADPH:quinone reductase-like Zn-dependent oxidoreductase